MSFVQYIGVILLSFLIAVVAAVFILLSDRVKQSFEYAYPIREVSTSYVTYNIEPAASGKHMVSLTNNSLFPQYFVAYESDAIEDNFGEFALNYALRAEVSYAGRVVSPASYGFDCGTGLVYVMIRPLETVRDTVDLQQRFTNESSIFSYLKSADTSVYVDLIDRQRYDKDLKTSSMRYTMRSGYPVEVKFSLPFFDMMRGYTCIAESESVSLCRELVRSEH